MTAASETTRASSDDFKARLEQLLEPILLMDDPRPSLSAYHDMPYAIFRYDPEDELPLRKQVTLLKTRLEQHGKRVHTISLAQCLHDALSAQRPIADWIDAEKQNGLEMLVDTIHAVLAEHASLVDLVAERLPPAPDPKRDLVFITRTGALFPVYRTFALLEQLKGKVLAPTILFYPGKLEPPSGLSFMGVLDAEHNYRSKIF